MQLIKHVISPPLYPSIILRSNKSRVARHRQVQTKHCHDIYAPAQTMSKRQISAAESAVPNHEGVTYPHLPQTVAFSRSSAVDAGITGTGSHTNGLHYHHHHLH